MVREPGDGDEQHARGDDSSAASPDSAAAGDEPRAGCDEPHAAGDESAPGARRSIADGGEPVPDGGESASDSGEPARDGDGAGDSFADQLSGDVSSVTTMVGHFYRGEMDRVNEWRSRLDRTTNWAVTIMAAILTFAFSSQNNPHYLLLVAMLTVVVLLGIDVRRYRTYDVWRARTRMLEQDVFAAVFDPETETEHSRWRQELASDLRRPSFKVPLVEALARRLRRVYLPLLLVLLAAWVARITVFEPQESAFQTARVVIVPGWLVVLGVGLTFAVALAVAFWPRERQAKGEVYERHKEGDWKD